jgi:dihydropteroate synthase
MYAEARYDDVVADVRRELCERVDAALAAGVAAERLVLDPGLGFAKRPEHDLALLGGLDRIIDLGFPVLVGASRKRFLGALLATSDGAPRPPDRRDDAGLAASVLAARAGAWGVRVHDVAGSADAARVVAALPTGAPEGPGAVRRCVAWPVPETLAHTAPGPGCLPASRPAADTERWRSA